MSTVSHGMNTAEVQALGNRLQTTSAVTLRDLAAAVEAAVGSSQGFWLGPDAERFRSWWPEKRARLLAMADDLHGFGQSALNNATEQLDASGGGSASPDPASSPMVSGPIATVGANGDGGASDMAAQGRTWQSVQADYDAWAAGAPARFRDGGESHYQCTGWANFRWQELGYDGIVSGHGGEMAANAPGQISNQPALHAMASYRSGEYGHVMIVEEISADGSRIRVSEMNVGDDNYEVGRPQEFRDDRWITRSADGNWFTGHGKRLEFAAFPG